jgi:hypothetical protein
LEQEPKRGPKVKEGKASITSKDREKVGKKKGRKKRGEEKKQEKEMRKKNKNNNPTYLKTIAPLQPANIFPLAIARTPP